MLAIDLVREYQLHWQIGENADEEDHPVDQREEVNKVCEEKKQTEQLWEIELTKWKQRQKYEVRIIMKYQRNLKKNFFSKERTINNKMFI